MNQPSNSPTTPHPVDPDLAEQANPGHGVPSQDPSAEAQQPVDSEMAEREAKSTLVGGGLLAGAAAGAAVGAAVAGPVGVIVGGTLGTVAGALGGAAAGSGMTPEDAETSEDDEGASPS